jgi:RNA ligase (TIGR02306 family)
LREYAIVGEADEAKFVNEGEDVTSFLGITKYEPPIPTSMAGEVFNAFGKTLTYDIENIKNFPDALIEGEEVVMTEKLHGTWACFGLNVEMNGDEIGTITPIVTSKGLSAKGLAFKDNEANEKNLYMKTFKELGMYDKLYDTVCCQGGLSVYILGEIYGEGVQDLQYGVNGKSFRAFDIYFGEPGSGEYLNYDDFKGKCDLLGIDTVPVLYRGPYSREIIEQNTNGKETVSGTEACIREGGVIKPVIERKVDGLGRVNIKSISEAYLLRKNGTEFT